MLDEFARGVGRQQLRVTDRRRYRRALLRDRMNAGHHVGGAQTTRLQRIDANDLLFRQPHPQGLARIAALELPLRNALRHEAILLARMRQKILNARARLWRRLLFFLRLLKFCPALGQIGRQFRTRILRRKPLRIILRRDRLISRAPFAPDRPLLLDLAPELVQRQVVEPTRCNVRLKRAPLRPAEACRERSFRRRGRRRGDRHGYGGHDRKDQSRPHKPPTATRHHCRPMR